MFVNYENKDNQMFRLDKLGGMDYPPHMHKHIEIVYLLEGEITICIDGKERLMQTGDASFCFPNSVHSFISKSKALFYILIVDINLTGDFAGKLLTYTPVYPFISKEKIRSDVLSCFDTMFSYYDKFFTMDDDVKYNKLAVKGYIQILISRLMAELELEEAGDASVTVLTKNLLDYIMKNFRNSQLSLKHIAAALNVSVPYLSNVFSKKIGTNYRDHLNLHRIRYAQRQITATEHNITDIAYDSGFEDIRTFNRAFKKAVGITPSQFRRSQIDL
ncbi:MAG: AraC family transcriptional regulator [Oscillospiraceae bacterium]|nr:AraC family transcriptional regulator [Oscillospiraceae bacterium]